jgi:hypothetical protein
MSLCGVISIDSKKCLPARQAMIGLLHPTVLIVHRFLGSMQTGLAIYSLLPLLAEFNGLAVRHSVCPIFARMMD